jgi:hypothetical protein
VTVIQILELETNDTQYGFPCHGLGSLVDPPKPCGDARARTRFLAVSVTRSGVRRRTSLCQGCASELAAKKAMPMPEPMNQSRRESGQSLIEFAFVLPIFLLVVLLVADGAAILWRFNLTTEIAQMVCRDASIYGPAQAQANGAQYSAKFGLVSTIAVSYVTPARNDVRATVMTPNKAILFGKGIIIESVHVAHVEIPAP